MLMSLLAEATQHAASEGWIALLIPLLLAIAKAWSLHAEAKQAKDAATKADAEARAKAAVAEAVILGVEAYKRTLKTREEQRAASQTIEERAKALGVEDALNPLVRRLTGSRPVVDADGQPKEVPITPPPPLDPPASDPFPRRAAALLLCVGLLVAGCVNRAIHEATVTAKVAVQHLRDTSEPSREWLSARVGTADGRGGTWTEARLRDVWAGEWRALEGAQDEIERATR